MTPFYKQDGITIYCGDCLEVLPRLGADSVDTCITDPPYGLDFMGHDWDHGIPGVVFWREVLRVLKPGATLLAFGGTRTFHRLACAIEDAGFELRDTIMWVYGSGFPKSHNISKAIDKAAGAKREVVKARSGPVPGSHGGGGRYGHGVDRSVTAPATPAARLWDGWGTALKPAWEPIIVAMKPRDGTFTQNALKWGVAGMNIDGGRIETEESTERQSGVNATCYGEDNRHGMMRGGTQGRWPANLVHDGSDEVLGLFPRTQSGKCPDGFRGEHRGQVYGKYAHNLINPDNVYGDSGSAARFFYCAKASSGERNAGLEGVETRMAAELTGRKDGSRGLSGSIEYGNSTNPYANGGSVLPRANYHPTVKPLALMQYLAHLTKTPTGGVVLDPFMGSGTTGMGAIMEGREFIGVELNEGYCEIARRRVAGAQPPLFLEDSGGER